VTGSPLGSGCRYNPDGPARVLGLHYNPPWWALNTRHLYGSAFLLHTWLRSSRRDSRVDEEKESSLWLMRLQEQRTRVPWCTSTLPWTTLAARVALTGDALILI
jgi:hypothetical protein